MSYHWISALAFLFAVLLADFASAAVHWDEMRVKHTWNAVPANWESLGNTTAGAMIKLHVALKPNQESALIDALFEVSNPRHPRYGAYLSKEQVADHVSPHPGTLDLVRAWLLHHGIRPSSISTTHGGEWLTVTDVLVTQANQLLGASYQLYRNLKTNDTVIRTVGYSLPAVLHTHIQTIAPTTHFPSTRGMQHTLRRRTSGVAPAKAPETSGKVVTARKEQHVTPSLLRWLYKTSEYTYTAAPGLNKVGIVGFEDEYPSQSDLTLFMAEYRSEAIDTRFTVIQWNGGRYNPSDPSGHANIGIQYAAAMAYPAPLVFYSVGGDTQWDRAGQPTATDMYLEWFGNILEEEDPPLTISIPYGEPERDLPVDYARSLCRLFGQLGERGVTVLVASGKDGVGAGNCVDADGVVQFVPEFPASCPYVTSVGGTANFRPESAANLSGGGFSTYFRTPGYQSTAVRRYLRRYPEFYDGLYNPNGRGYPDISAQAIDYEVIVNGELLYAEGTTCAASTAAGIISLLNDLFAANDRYSFGFINPLLYSGGLRGIKDIKFGSNPGCNTTGFVAASGWDPTTGLGTLQLGEIVAMYLENWESSPFRDDDQ